MLLDAGYRRPGIRRPLRPQVSIGLTDREVLDAVQADYGGRILTKTRPDRKPMHIWSVRDGEALGLLGLLRPHLVVRRRQRLADALLEYPRAEPGFTKDPGLTVRRYERTVQLRERMRTLNDTRLDGLPHYVRRSATEDDYAYIAGIIDGEGHITKDRRLYVSSTDPELCAYLAQFGGTAAPERAAAGNWRAVWRWTARKAETEAMAPHLLRHMQLTRKRNILQTKQVPEWLPALLPATTREVAETRNMRHTSACALLANLEAAGLVQKVGTRPTRRAGRPPAVYALIA